MTRIIPRARVCLLVLAAGIGLASRAYAVPQANPPANPPAADLRTEHYDLHVEGLDVGDVGAMMEQLHGQLRGYFGTAPQGRLSVAVYATSDRWASALQADRQLVPQNAGGYYAPYTHKAYLSGPPSAYLTRQLVLHEATHQFHWLVATGNMAPSADWYTEGIAEYFGMHNWDGHRLQTGVVPAVTLEDYPAAAMKNFEAAGSDIEKMLPRANRPESWALVHFLLNEHPEQFHRLATMLDSRHDATDAWRQVFGRDSSKLSGEFHEWIKNHAQPWRIVWTAWQQRGDAIEGDSPTSAMTILKETPKALTVEIDTRTAGGAAGIVFAYKSANDFYLLQARPGGKVCVTRRLNDAWVAVSADNLPPGEGPCVLSVAQDAKSTTLSANGRKLSSVAAVGQVGLNVENCRTLFRTKDAEYAISSAAK